MSPKKKEYDRDKERYRAESRKYYWDNRDKVITRQKEYYREHREQAKKWSLEYYYKNHEERKKINAARAMTKKYVPLNDQCQICGNSDNLEHHHPNYDKPLEVITLCRNCHKTIHSIIRAYSRIKKKNSDIIQSP